MTYTIKKGNHYCSGLSVGGFNSHTTSAFRIVTFSKECLILPYDDTCRRDINKLFGWSYGLHQTDSIRVGWRSELGGIHLYAYMYMNGVRKVKSIGWAMIASPVYVGMEHMVESQIIKFTVGESTTLIPWSGCDPSWGYDLRPYYGGNCGAPETMTIEMW